MFKRCGMQAMFLNGNLRILRIMPEISLEESVIPISILDRDFGPSR